MGNQKETQKNPQYKYASTREKLCFGIGAIGKDAICNLVGAFLMLYFTDTLYLAPAFVGVLFFVARIWDAINDPMMGMIVDNTHTRFGKFRIWLVIGTLVNSVVFVLLFHSFNLSGTALYVYVSVMYEIIAGKPKLSGLPATYTESEEEAQTLRIFLKDALTGAKLALLYTIFDEYSAIARSAYIENAGEKNLHVLNMMSLSLDLPDKDYEWMQLSGAWSRERYIKNRTLEHGITAIDSMRGNSSHEHNPFLALKRHNTDENAGEAIGISLVYSGNFRMQAEVDTHDVTRITAGINPEGFDWKLEPGESFQTPEAVLVYSENGLNGMSQTFQKLYAKRLARGYWRDKARPILNNNWEVTYFDFTEDRLVEIARMSSECMLVKMKVPSSGSPS